MSLNKVIELCEASIDYTEGPNNDTTFGKWFGLNNPGAQCLHQKCILMLELLRQ
jgi:hypothetical protein